VTIHDRFDAGRNVQWVVLEGALTDDDLLAYARRSAGSAELPEGHDIVVDLRKTTLSQVTSHTLRRVADLFTRADRTPEACRLALVSGEDAGFGLSRMYQAFRSDSVIEVRVFREMAEACAWLGIEPDPASGRVAPGADEPG